MRGEGRGEGTLPSSIYFSHRAFFFALRCSRILHAALQYLASLLLTTNHSPHESHSRSVTSMSILRVLVLAFFFGTVSSVKPHSFNRIRSTAFVQPHSFNRSAPGAARGPVAAGARVRAPSPEPSPELRAPSPSPEPEPRARAPSPEPEPRARYSLPPSSISSMISVSIALALRQPSTRSSQRACMLRCPFCSAASAALSARRASSVSASAALLTQQTANAISCRVALLIAEPF